MIVGSSEGDLIYGNGGNDLICMGDGADRYQGYDKLPGPRHPGAIVYGDRGNDVFGGRGRDNIRGQSGNDTIWGDQERDRIRGNRGTMSAGAAVPATGSRRVRRFVLMVATPGEAVASDTSGRLAGKAKE